MGNTCATCCGKTEANEIQTNQETDQGKKTTKTKQYKGYEEKGEMPEEMGEGKFDPESLEINDENYNNPHVMEIRE